MESKPVWDPFTQWKDRHIDWVKPEISKEDLKKFTKRNDLKGLFQALGFLLYFAMTGTWAYVSFQSGNWVQMAMALYLHGAFYFHFGDALHELGHNTVFKRKWLTGFFLHLYAFLYWPWNPQLYRISHVKYHHPYTLHQNSDGEDTPGYIKITPWLIIKLFVKVIEPKIFLQCLGRLLTLKPTSKGWRGRGYALDSWEKFILSDTSKANVKERKRVRYFAIYALVTQGIFIFLCIYFKLWFLPVLITLAPFYGPRIHGFICGVHQHTACEANHPDFRISCGDARLDRFSSFMYWHMIFHVEHHSFAGVPCYNLRAFSRFLSDQLPEKEWAIPRLKRLNKLCQEKYGSRENWREQYGRFKGY
jgi:fatty acid desaturase